MEINLSIQHSFASQIRLMVIIHIHLMLYLLECTESPEWNCRESVLPIAI